MVLIKAKSKKIYKESAVTGVLTGISFLAIKLLSETATVLTSPLADWNYVTMDPAMLAVFFVYVGGSGAIAALLRSLYRPIVEDFNSSSEADS